MLDELGATEAERARIHAPAGLDIGARSAAEIALSICAGIVAARPRLARVAPVPVDAAAQARAAVAIDPVCGMEVAVSPASLHVGDVYFCGSGCMATWKA